MAKPNKGTCPMGGSGGQTPGGGKGPMKIDNPPKKGGKGK